MRTTLDLPQNLINEAKLVLGAKTKTEAIVSALREMIGRHRSKKLLKLKGSLKTNYNHKATRKKR